MLRWVGFLVSLALFGGSEAKAEAVFDRLEAHALERYFPDGNFQALINQADCGALDNADAELPFSFCHQMDSPGHAARVFVRKKAGSVDVTLSGDEGVRRFFLPRFLRLWRQGEAVDVAAQQALTHAQALFDRLTRVRVRAAENGVSSLQNLLGTLLGGLVPPAGNAPGGATAFQSMDEFNELGTLGLWDYWRDSLATPDAPDADDDVIEIDGEAIRYMFESLKDWLGPSFGVIYDGLARVEIRRYQGKEREEARIILTSASPHDIKIKPKSESKRFELYGAAIPQTMEFRLRAKGTRVWFTSAPEKVLAPTFFVNIPVLKDEVRFRELKLDLLTGNFSAKVRAGGLISAVADGKLYAQHLKGLNLWKTFWASLLDLFNPRSKWKTKEEK
ncbi:MAG: hypothetical protein AB7F66_01240 [Bacteriovoracia bacterium]